MPHPLYSAAPAALLAALCSFASLAGDYDWPATVTYYASCMGLQ